jgi:hypothetical protein
MSDTVSDTDVKQAVAAAAGLDLTGQPENDVQAVMFAHAKGDITLAEAVLALVNIALVQKGVNEGDGADWAKAGMLIGPDVVKGIIKLAALFA